MEGILDTPVIDEPIVDDLQGQVDDPQPDDPAVDLQDPAASADKIDGRKFNPEWSSYLKSIREANADNPKIGDMLTKMRDNYARYQEVMGLAPKGLEDVRGWKTQIDALGGPESAAALMERGAQMDAFNERLAAGDFGAISELPENMQAGFYQMMPAALSHLAQNDDKAFAAMVQPHFQAALAGTGLGDHFKAIYERLGDNEEAKAMVKQAYEWFSQQTKGGGPLPQGTKTVDPQVKALQDKLSKYESSADESFVKSITDSSETHLKESFGKLADVYVKQLNLTKEQQDDLLLSFNQNLTAKLGADTAFQGQLKAFRAMKNRSPESVTNYVRSKIDEHAKPLLDALVQTRYGTMAKRKAAPVAGTPAVSNGATHVAQIPDQSQWDMDKMEAIGYEETAKKGVYHLKGGKTVQVVKQA